MAQVDEERMILPEGSDLLSNAPGIIPHIRWGTVYESMEKMKPDIQAARRCVARHFGQEDHTDILDALGIGSN